MSIQVTFESVQYVTQEEFAGWVAKHEGDLESYELLNGRIVMNPPAGWPQGGTSPIVIGLLYQSVTLRQRGRVLAGEQGFELPSGDTVAPDAAVLLNETWESCEPPEVGKFLRMVPDLVVEVLSSSTASRDRGEKKAVYEHNGVREYWLVDVVGQRLERFWLEDGGYGRPSVAGPGQSLDSKLIPDLVFSVDDLVPS